MKFNDKKFTSGDKEYDLTGFRDCKSLTKTNETYNLRKDVITKTIFRALRKFYVKEFKSFYDYTKGYNTKK